MIVFLKATEPTPTSVVPHVRDERLILAYVADRSRSVAELPEVAIEPRSPVLLLMVAAEP